MKITTTLVLLFLAASMANLNAQTPQDNFWITNGDVYAIQKSGNTVYLGGEFSWVAPYTGCGAAINTVSGELRLNYVKPNANVDCVIPDGAGGWFIGGDFDYVSEQPRSKLARINADGSLHSFNPGVANGLGVDDMKLVGNILFIAGSFTHVEGQARANLAAIDITTGHVTAWNPHVDDGQVRAIEVNSNIVYVGGSFNSINGQTRNGIAAIDGTSGALTAWDPNADEEVYDLDFMGSDLLVGGDFDNIGGQVRHNIAALNTSSGNATTWNPNLGGNNSYVNTIAVSGSAVFIGGGFTSVGGQTRNRIAAISATSGTPLPWNPNADAPVGCIVISSSGVIVSGVFSNIGGQARNRIAALDINTGTATSWNPNPGNPGGIAFALSVQGNTVYAGGNFSGMGGVARNNIAAFDATTGAATPWTPSANGAVFTLETNGGIVYAGGDFTIIGAETRNRIAALNTTTGAATSWNPDANNTVRTIELLGQRLIVGGDFTSIGGQARNRIAAFKESDGTILSWNPSVDGGSVMSIVGSGTDVYLAGNFDHVGGQARNRIAAIDVVNNTPHSWNPGADGPVHALEIDGSTIYAGGEFTNIGGQARNHIAALDANVSGSGGATTWNPNANGPVRCLEANGGALFAGGDFTLIGGGPRFYMAAFNTANGNLTPWRGDGPYGGGVVYSIFSDGVKVYAGGSFTYIGHGQHWAPRTSIVAFDQAGALPVGFGPLQASMLGDKLSLNWTTLTENNNSHFDIEASTDGTNFKKIGTVASRAKGGVSVSALNYDFSTPVSGAMAGLTLLPAACLLFFTRRRRLLSVALALAIGALVFAGCRKQELAMEKLSPKLYVRIAQVDKDGARAYSKVVVVNER